MMENNLKQIRNKKNLLQTKVAMDLNITQETISSFFAGRSGSNCEQKSARAFGTCVGRRLGFRENKIARSQLRLAFHWTRRG